MFDHPRAYAVVGDAIPIMARISLRERLQRARADPAIAAAAHASTDRRSFVLEQTLRDSPALSGRADHIALGHAHIVEESFAKGRCAADQTYRPDGDARRLHVEQNESNPVVFRHIRIGAHEAKHPVRMVGVRGPDLRAIDDVVVAILDRAGLQPGEVRTGSGFAVSLAPPDFAARDFRNVLPALLRRAEFQQRWADHARPHAAAQGRPRMDALEFLVQHLRLLLRQAAAAVFRGPHGQRPPAIRHPVQPQPGVRVLVPGPPTEAGSLIRRHGRAHAGRTVLLQPGTRFFSKIHITTRVAVRFLLPPPSPAPQAHRCRSADLRPRISCRRRGSRRCVR